MRVVCRSRARVPRACECADALRGAIFMDLVIFLLRGLLAGAPEAAPAGLGPDLVIFLLRGLLAGAPEAAPAGLGLDLFILLLKSY